MLCIINLCIIIHLLCARGRAWTQQPGSGIYDLNPQVSCLCQAQSLYLVGGATGVQPCRLQDSRNVFFITRFHRHFPLPKPAPALGALKSIFFLFRDFASLLALHTFSIPWIPPICSRTSTHLLSPAYFSPTLLQTSTIILSPHLHCIFLRVASMLRLSFTPGLCPTPKSLKWSPLLSFSWPHSQLQPLRTCPGLLQEPRE